MLKAYVKALNLLHALKSEEGQDLIEYALLAGLIAVVCVTNITAVGTKVNALFAQIAGQIP
jgi:pilus assembly protein Flp/PilA